MANNSEHSPQSSEYWDARTRRQHLRISPDWLKCDAGEILDISLGGAMIKCKSRFKGVQAIRIWNETKGLILQAEILWTNSVAFHHHEIGVHWRNLGAENQATLEELIFPYGIPIDDLTQELEPESTLKLVEDDGTEVVPVQFEGDEDDEAVTLDDRRLRYLVYAWPHLPNEMQENILQQVLGVERK